ncbi:hypothetical protein [Rufibacter roseus]|uniref:Uncharacterized protein n=1 Tax=Rufibacter roseus TaxID=1567108 RepID=A0ABW2DSW2_9BACT|nr:hypothetical protein [Rufibacter roseus]
MMLIFEKQPINIDYLEAEALAMAIYEFIVQAPKRKHVPLEEILSLTPLARLNRRLVSRANSERLKPKPKPFVFKLSPEELLSVRRCIQCQAHELKLQVVLGKIQQKALNFT